MKARKFSIPQPCSKWILIKYGRLLDGHPASSWLIILIVSLSAGCTDSAVRSSPEPEAPERIFSKKLLISVMTLSILVLRGSSFSIFSTSERRASVDWNIRLNRSLLCDSSMASRPFSLM